jgi:hypothetical protein
VTLSWSSVALVKSISLQVKSVILHLQSELSYNSGCAPQRSFTYQSPVSILRLLAMASGCLSSRLVTKSALRLTIVKHRTCIGVLGGALVCAASSTVPAAIFSFVRFVIVEQRLKSASSIRFRDM